MVLHGIEWYCMFRHISSAIYNHGKLCTWQNRRVVAHVNILTWKHTKIYKNAQNIQKYQKNTFSSLSQTGSVVGNSAADARSGIRPMPPMQQCNSDKQTNHAIKAQCNQCIGGSCIDSAMTPCHHDKRPMPPKHLPP